MHSINNLQENIKVCVFFSIHINSQLFLVSKAKVEDGVQSYNLFFFFFTIYKWLGIMFRENIFWLYVELNYQ